ncbi:hypothetical protein BX070DRAFT_78076 [Coemansia spiralis]|nr:hypothetical protein BX070DRAFT_78076 [Coemansia spiralis]
MPCLWRCAVVVHEVIAVGNKRDFGERKKSNTQDSCEERLRPSTCMHCCYFSAALSSALLPNQSRFCVSCFGKQAAVNVNNGQMHRNKSLWAHLVPISLTLSILSFSALSLFPLSFVPLSPTLSCGQITKKFVSIQAAMCRKHVDAKKQASKFAQYGSEQQKQYKEGMQWKKSEICATTALFLLTDEIYVYAALAKNIAAYI